MLNMLAKLLSNLFKGKIVEETKPVDLNNEQLYKIDYSEQDCFHPEKVIQRARTRLGETK